jgi:hypothetical protein
MLGHDLILHEIMDIKSHLSTEQRLKTRGAKNVFYKLELKRRWRDAKATTTTES